MIKGILLGGIAGIGAGIGAIGVLRVKQRLEILQELKHDMKTIENLIVRQHMTLRNALCCTATASRIGKAYRLLAEKLSQAFDTAEKMLQDSGMMAEFAKAELSPRELGILRGYFIRISESISAEEITLITTRYVSELGKAIAEIDRYELGRAKVLRTVWMLAGLGIVVILI